MRKYVFAIWVVLLPLILSACEGEADYWVLQVDHCMCQSPANHSTEVELATNSFADEARKNTTYTYEFNGVHYDLVYERTATHYLSNCDTVDYAISTDALLLEIGVNERTGDITWFFYRTNPTDQPLEPENPLSETECIQIARDFLRGYVSDADAFILSDIEYRPSSTRLPSYSITLMRQIDGHKTSESAQICVNENGEITSYSLHSLGQLRNAQWPSDSDMEVIQKNIEAKLEEIYGPVREEYVVEYGEREMCLIKLADGSLALEIQQAVTLTAKDEAAKEEAETVRLLVYL